MRQPLAIMTRIANTLTQCMIRRLSGWSCTTGG
jgi:hypothetical protein